MRQYPKQNQSFDSQPRPLLDEQQQAKFASWIDSELQLLERRFEHLATPFAGRMPWMLLMRPGHTADGPSP